MYNIRSELLHLLYVQYAQRWNHSCFVPLKGDLYRRCLCMRAFSVLLCGCSCCRCSRISLNASPLSLLLPREKGDLAKEWPTLWQSQSSFWGHHARSSPNTGSHTYLHSESSHIFHMHFPRSGKFVTPNVLLQSHPCSCWSGCELGRGCGDGQNSHWTGQWILSLKTWAVPPSAAPVGHTERELPTSFQHHSVILWTVLHTSLSIFLVPFILSFDLNVLLLHVYTHILLCHRPNTGRSFYEETRSDLLLKYIAVTPELAGKALHPRQCIFYYPHIRAQYMYVHEHTQKSEPGWRAQYESTKGHCIHGPSCKNASDCTS